MPQCVKEIEAIGIYGRFDLRLQFYPDVNIVFGRNGAGKTTLLHLLANILQGDYSRFAFLLFRSVRVVLGDDRVVALAPGEAEGESTVRATLDGECVAEVSVRRAREQGARHMPADVSPRASRQMLEEMELERMGDVEPLVRTAYFPAFRTMIEAWAAMAEPMRRFPPERWRAQATRRARDWFGDFVPPVTFPSVLEIEDGLAGEIAGARAAVSRADRQQLSQAFLDIFRALSEADAEALEPAEAVLSDIGDLFVRLGESPLKAESMILTQINRQLRELISKFRLGDRSETTAVRVLKVYREMLTQIVDVQERSFAETQRYLTSVNEFLEEKDLVIDPEPPRYRGTAVGVRFSDESYARGLRALSSGERQIVTLIYAATHMSKQQVVLIDEPEISLHVDWQRMLIPKMAEQLGERQIIACTHSPVIGSDYEDRVVELKLAPTAEPVAKEEAEEEEEDL